MISKLEAKQKLNTQNISQRNCFESQEASLENSPMTLPFIDEDQELNNNEDMKANCCPQVQPPLYPVIQIRRREELKWTIYKLN